MEFTIKDLTKEEYLKELRNELSKDSINNCVRERLDEVVEEVRGSLSYSQFGIMTEKFLEILDLITINETNIANESLGLELGVVMTKFQRAMQLAEKNAVNNKPTNPNITFELLNFIENLKDMRNELIEERDHSFEDDNYKAGIAYSLGIVNKYLKDILEEEWIASIETLKEVRCSKKNG